MLEIQNSLGKKREQFEPINGKTVNMYTCGITVYDSCHIGHARSVYVFEVMRRYLKYRGFNVNFVRNITDIDDKIINKAKERSMDWKDLVDEQIASYHKDLELLDLPQADQEPRATDNIDEMITYIQGLIDKGYAYTTETGIYFSVRKVKDYGKLSNRTVEDMQSSGRISTDESKKDPLDFALWKATKEGEPYWDSPWGKGRPGWHIECSVMSQKYLKVDTLDIHGGGRDLIFPHHENELAQAESLTGKDFAKYWIHHGLLTINKEKMAKSLGNFFTIKDVLSKYHPDILKMLFLGAHYSSSVDYSEDRMEEKKKALESVLIFMGKELKLVRAGFGDSTIEELRNSLRQVKDKFVEAMDDDFNMPKGLAVLFELAHIGNKMLENAGTIEKDIADVKALISEFADIFVLSLKVESADGILDEEIEKLVKERSQSKIDKNYAQADDIRKKLEEQGIILEDSKDGTTWRRKI